MVVLCNRMPSVRIYIADALHVSLLTYGDNLFGDDDADKYEQCLTLLQNTQWSVKPVAELKPIRNQLCALLNVPEPASKT